jgi:hypothetical protein
MEQIMTNKWPLVVIEEVPFTKWTVLESRVEEAYRNYLKAQQVLDNLTKTRFNGHCTGCGTYLATEADFAKHFVIPDEYHLNIGECPNPADATIVRPMESEERP